MTIFAGLAACVAGLAVGVLNGFAIAVLGVPPLVATLAIASVVNGALIVGVSVFQPSSTASPALVALAGRATAGMPNIVLVWIGAIALALWLLNRSAWGRRLCGTGANRTVALLSGTNTTVVRIMAYALSGGLGSFRGLPRDGLCRPGIPRSGRRLCADQHCNRGDRRRGVDRWPGALFGRCLRGDHDDGTGQFTDGHQYR